MYFYYFYYFEKKNDDLYNKKIRFIDNIISIFNYYTPAPPMNNIVKLTQSIAVKNKYKFEFAGKDLKCIFPFFYVDVLTNAHISCSHHNIFHERLCRVWDRPLRSLLIRN